MRMFLLAPLLLVAGCSLNPGVYTYVPPGTRLGAPVPLTPPAGAAWPVTPAAPPLSTGLGQAGPTAIVPPPAPVEQSPLPGPAPDTTDQATAPPAGTEGTPAADQATTQPAAPDTAVPDSGQALDQRLNAIRSSLAQDRSNTPPPPPTRPGHYGGLSSSGDVVPNTPTNSPTSP